LCYYYILYIKPDNGPNGPKRVANCYWSTVIILVNLQQVVFIVIYTFHIQRTVYSDLFL